MTWIFILNIIKSFVLKFRVWIVDIHAHESGTSF